MRGERYGEIKFYVSLVLYHSKNAVKSHWACARSKTVKLPRMLSNSNLLFSFYVDIYTSVNYNNKNSLKLLA